MVSIYKYQEPKAHGYKKLVKKRCSDSVFYNRLGKDIFIKKITVRNLWEESWEGKRLSLIFCYANHLPKKRSFNQFYSPIDELV